MKTTFDLGKYLSDNIGKMMADILRKTPGHPKESAFLARFSLACKTAAKKRAKAGSIPPFLIASITSACNLHCEGCYSRHNHACTDSAPVNQLSQEDWERIFSEAKELGISFVLLAGGEPLLRRDVLEGAAKFPEILFPVFTNGTLLDEHYLTLFDKHRNLVPVLSIEGEQAATDARRGEGVFAKLQETMQSFRKHHLLFGASVTVTTENLAEVTGDSFLQTLQENGCKVVIYVEYVPVSERTKPLAPGDAERAALKERLAELRSKDTGMVYISFPGDEHSVGGCLAAGRGFFHINSHGGAEPCPFSPYSDISVKDTSLLEALHSPLFAALRSEHILNAPHSGGCVLFEQKDKVEALLSVK